VTFGRSPGLARDASGLCIRVVRTLAHWRRHPAHPLSVGLIAAIKSSDIVHTHHFRSTPSRLAALSRRRAGGVVTTDHGLGDGAARGPFSRLFDRFLVVSQYSAATLRVPPAKTRVVYGGADPSRFRPEPAQARAGVLFVGRLTPHKGIDRLLRALPGDAELSIVGTDGHDRTAPERDYPDHLRRLAAGRRVRFRGAVPEDALPGVHRRAAVFVLPSVDRTCYGRPVAISELLGLSVLEAMASATPVVASRIGGVPELVVDGETGFLVDPGDVDALSDRIASLLSDRRLARRLGDNARAAVTERFTWQACARRCVAAYRELVT
jgi:glycosyltransferase involved in cell wall biosynthesis